MAWWAPGPAKADHHSTAATNGRPREIGDPCEKGHEKTRSTPCFLALSFTGKDGFQAFCVPVADWQTQGE